MNIPDPLFNPRTMRRCRAGLVALAALVGCAGASAQIYAGTDASGTLVLGSFASESSSVLLIAGDAPEAPAKPATAAVAAQRTVAAPKALEPAIREAARRHSVSESLLTAVIAVESGFDPRAVSPKGAKGLMQLMPDTARRFGVGDVFAVNDNLHGGAAYLSQLLALFENDRSLALAAYNAGEGAVLRAGRRIPAYAETRQYVAKVLAYAGRNPEREPSGP
jgi:soluble lytic murein transglycosylase-like protein